MNNDKAISEYTAFHSEWLHQPITVKLKTLLDEHEAKIIDSIANASFSDVEGIQLRGLGNQLQTIKALKKLAFDTTIFVEKTIQQLNK